MAFRLDAGALRYANVKGYAGEEFGLGLSDDWHSLQRVMNHFRHALPGADPERLKKIPVENLGLSPHWMLAPDDSTYYLDHGAPNCDGLYPILIRVAPEGLERPPSPLGSE